MSLFNLALQAVTAEPASSTAQVAQSVAQADPATTIALLVLLGLLLVVVELFIPGGVIGTIGGIVFLIAVFLATKTYGGTWGVIVMLGSALGTIVVVAIGWTMLPKTRLGGKLFLTPNPGAKTDPATMEAKAKQSIVPGNTGVCLTTLRPSGSAKIGEWRVDVVTRGEYIEQGSPIEVVGVDGTRILVRQKDQG